MTGWASNPSGPWTELLQEAIAEYALETRFGSPEFFGFRDHFGSNGWLRVGHGEVRRYDQRRCAPAADRPSRQGPGWFDHVSSVLDGWLGPPLRTGSEDTPMPLAGLLSSSGHDPRTAVLSPSRASPVPHEAPGCHAVGCLIRAAPSGGQ